MERSRAVLGDIVEIHVDRIEDNPLVSKRNQEFISELASSISQNGLLQPIKVRPHPLRPEFYQVVYGHRRLSAVRMLGMETIEAEIANVSDESMVSLALTENLERNNFTDYEIGLLLKTLNERFGLTMDQISKIACRSKAYVCQHIAMTRMFDSDRVDPCEGKRILESLSEHQARIIQRVLEPDRRFELAKLVLSQSISLEALEKLVGHPNFATSEIRKHRYDWRSKQRKSEAEIRTLIHEAVQSFSERDVSLLLSIRVPKIFTLFDDWPPASSLLDYNQAAENNMKIIRQTDNLRLSYDNLRVFTFGEFSYATLFVNYQLRVEGKLTDIRSRVTMIFVREHGKWLLTHEHWSRLDEDTSLGVLHHSSSSHHNLYRSKDLP